MEYSDISQSTHTSTKTVTESLREGLRGPGTRLAKPVRLAAPRAVLSQSRQKSVMWILYVG